MRTAVVALLLCSALTACSSRDQPASSTLTISQPTFAELSRFLPGGVPARTAPRQAPLPCGGTAKSTRRATTAIKVHHSLSAISVSQYQFANDSAVNAYVDNLKTHPTSSGANGDSCHVAVPNSGDFYPGGNAYLADDGYYVLTATTAFGPGSYQGGYLHTSIAYVVHGDLVFVVRVDRQDGSVDPAFLGVLLNAFEEPGGPTLSTAGHPVSPTPVAGVIHPTDYDSYLVGPNAAVTSALCPQATISGKTYNIAFEGQLPHPTPAGLVVPGAAAGTSRILHWGTRVTLGFDRFNKLEHEYNSPCRNGTTTNVDFVDVVSISPAT